jgi:uncharacterized membrane protein YhaH (DUF805 family)
MDFQNLDPQKLLPEFQKLLMTSDGRIGRQDFWIGAITLGIINLIGQKILGGLGWAIFGTFGEHFLAGIVGLVCLYPYYCVAVKRSNDLDYPQTYVQVFCAALAVITVLSMFLFFGLAFIVGFIIMPIFAIAALALLVVLGFFQGTQGPNRYGPDPLARQPA